MPNLAAVDWLIPAIYFFFTVSIGLALAPYTTTGKDFLQAGRALPAWLCGLAFLGGIDVIGMGAAGAEYGLKSALFYGLGAIPAMLFAGLFMMPLYYGSEARSVPGFLRLRFDEKTRAVNACLFLAATVLGAGIALYAMARLVQALHVFDSIVNAMHLPPQGGFILTMALPAAVALAYIVPGGLAGAMYNQVLQLFVVVAGFLPMVLVGLKKVGGWNGLKAALPAATYGQAWNGRPGTGMAGMGLAVGLGLVLGAGYWCTDFRVLQTAMAAKDRAVARRAPLIAAAAMVLLPFLLILPGLLAIEQPTPHTTMVVRNENGSIYHEITVVPLAAEAGQGLVPAHADAAGKPIKAANGRAVLDYAMATPNTMLQFLPNGVLGLGLTALLACLMSGVAAGIMAFTTVFTCDLYQPYIRKGAADGHYVKVGRWAAAGATVLAVGAGCAATRLNSLVDAAALVLAVVNAPLLATFVLGMFWKRTTGHGAFAGLIAGTAAAVVHQGLTLPADAQRGWHGGWIAVLGRYPSGLAQSFWTAVCALGVNAAVTVAVSLCTRARPETELAGLVHSLTKPEPADPVWWKRPEGLAGMILLAAVAVSLILA